MHTPSFRTIVQTATATELAQQNAIATAAGLEPFGAVEDELAELAAAGAPMAPAEHARIARWALHPDERVPIALLAHPRRLVAFTLSHARGLLFCRLITEWEARGTAWSPLADALARGPNQWPDTKQVMAAWPLWRALHPDAPAVPPRSLTAEQMLQRLAMTVYREADDRTWDRLQAFAHPAVHAMAMAHGPAVTPARAATWLAAHPTSAVQLAQCGTHAGDPLLDHMRAWAVDQLEAAGRLLQEAERRGASLPVWVDPEGHRATIAKDVLETLANHYAVHLTAADRDRLVPLLSTRELIMGSGIGGTLWAALAVSLHGFTEPQALRLLETARLHPSAHVEFAKMGDLTATVYAALLEGVQPQGPGRHVAGADDIRCSVAKHAAATSDPACRVYLAASTDPMVLEPLATPLMDEMSRARLSRMLKDDRIAFLRYELLRRLPRSALRPIFQGDDIALKELGMRVITDLVPPDTPIEVEKRRRHTRAPHA